LLISINTDCTKFSKSGCIADQVLIFMRASLLTIISAFFLLISSVLMAQPAQSNFVRFVPEQSEWEGRLETSITSYENVDGVEVDLVAAVHIADREYYQQLNDYFKTRDAVLYELIAEPDERPGGQVQSGGSAISFVQLAMANFLDVDFQLEFVDYSPDNFIHADLSPARLLETMQAKGENIFTMFLSLALAEMANQQMAISQGAPPSSFTLVSIIQALSSTDKNRALKYLFAEELSRTGATLRESLLDDQLTIIGDRNRAALTVLATTLEDRNRKAISIFYGAAHMPGLEAELIERFGFTKASESWLTAWEIP